MPFRQNPDRELKWPDRPTLPAQLRREPNGPARASGPDILLALLWTCGEKKEYSPSSKLSRTRQVRLLRASALNGIEFFDALSVAPPDMDGQSAELTMVLLLVQFEQAVF